MTIDLLRKDMLYKDYSFAIISLYMKPVLRICSQIIINILIRNSFKTIINIF